MNSNGDKLVVSHINIRQSISILVLKLIFIEVMFAVLLIFFRSMLFTAETLGVVSINSPLESVGITGIFILGAGIKMFLTVYVVLLWLNEYYEITPSEVIHQRGIIFRKTSRYSFEHVQNAEVFQGVFGKTLNYGTISLLDRRRNRLVDLFLIHNPMRYMKVLDTMIPRLDEERKLIRGKVYEIPED